MNKFILIIIASTLASKFSSDIRNQKLCADSTALRKVDSKFPKLESCYENSSLFFSTLGVPCSSECFDVTVEASKFIYDSCQLSLPVDKTSLLRHKESVYSLWANRDAASVVCKKQNKRLTCLEEFNRSATQIANEETLNPDLMCHSCHHQMYRQFNADPYSIPTVYYGIVTDPEKVLNTLGEICEWN